MKLSAWCIKSIDRELSICNEFRIFRPVSYDNRINDFVILNYK